MAVQLIFVRHGQASFGAADYDNLSEIGHEQAARLGTLMARAGLRASGFWAGTLRRQQDTVAPLRAALGGAPVQTHAGLNEFDNDALLRAWLPADAPRPEGRAAYFGALRAALLEWQSGGVPSAPESWAEFCARVDAAVQAMADAAGDDPVIAASSGGPISALAARVLGAGDGAPAALQMQIQNASLTRVLVTSKGLRLQSFNENWLAAEPDAARLITHS